MEAVKVVVGVDADRRYLPAVRLLGRLGLPLGEVVLAHALEVPVEHAGLTDDAAGEPAGIGYDAALSALSDAVTDCASLGAKARAELVTGLAADGLIALAERHGADMIAVQSERKGAFRSFFFGSVSRGLAIASPVSLLISKGEPRAEGPLRIVFATDHSPYCGAALDQFLRLRPAGIRSIVVLSAVATSDYMFWVNHLGLPPDGDHVPLLQQEIAARSAQVVEKLDASGYEAKAFTPACSLIEAVDETMATADLLAMGAQGHGFVERLLIGSNSLHQVIIEPHPILLLRPPAMSA